MGWAADNTRDNAVKQLEEGADAREKSMLEHKWTCGRCPSARSTARAEYVTHMREAHGVDLNW